MTGTLLIFRTNRIQSDQVLSDLRPQNYSLPAMVKPTPVLKAKSIRAIKIHSVPAVKKTLLTDHPKSLILTDKRRKVAVQANLKGKRSNIKPKPSKVEKAENKATRVKKNIFNKARALRVAKTTENPKIKEVKNKSQRRLRKIKRQRLRKRVLTDLKRADMRELREEKEVRSALERSLKIRSKKEAKVEMVKV